LNVTVAPADLITVGYFVGLDGDASRHRLPGGHDDDVAAQLVASDDVLRRDFAGDAGGM
jgi:hypothetical protein